MMILKFIYSFVHNWGFAIIIITILVRGCMYPLTKAQYTSMAKMKLIAPKLKEIRDRYQQDPENYRKATMDLYKTEKVNPANSYSDADIYCFVLGFDGIYRLASGSFCWMD